MLKRPARADRPTFPKKPTHYGGGRICWFGAKSALRVYARAPSDNIETTIQVDPTDPSSKKGKWGIACANIETDPRPAEC